MNNYSELEIGNLRFDGMYIVAPDKVKNMLLDGVTVDKLITSNLNKECDKFNQFSHINKLRVEDRYQQIFIDHTWNIPIKYNELNVANYLMDLWNKRQGSEKELERIALELEAFENNNAIDLLKTLIFVLDTFKKHNVIWGVGRGSSSASYILYLIGLHMVDPIKYDIPMSEFFKVSESTK